MTVAILGLGEAGSAIARDLAGAGVDVHGFDPAGVEGLDGVDAFPDPAAAADGVEAVLSLNSAAAAVEAAASVAPALAAEALYADLNTAAPARKREVADALGPGAGRYADVALIGPVPGKGLSTPALASGSGAARFNELFAPLGMPVTVVGTEPGEAAARKLARSVFGKGLAAAIGEALAAAQRLGCEEWLYADLQRTLEGADGALLERLIDGSRAHAARRSEEMAAAVAMLAELEVEPRIAAAAEGWLRELAGADEGSRR